MQLIRFLVATAIIMAGQTFSHVSAATEAEVLSIGQLSLATISTSDGKTILGQGQIVGRPGNSSYLLTASHVLHNGEPLCGSSGAPPDLNLSLQIVGTGRKIAGPFVLVGENPCSDLALVEIPNESLAVACYTRGYATGEGIVVSARLATSVVVDGSGNRVALLSDVTASGKLSAWYPIGVITYTAGTTKGYSGAGVLSFSSGLFLGIHQGSPIPVAGAPQPAPDDRIGRNSEAINAFLKSINAPVTLTFASSINDADAICLGL